MELSADRCSAGSTSSRASCGSGTCTSSTWSTRSSMPTMDAETKKKVVPELMPRALYWFRWGAAYTWVTGVLLLLIVYYHGGIMFDARRRLGRVRDHHDRARLRRAVHLRRALQDGAEGSEGRLRRRPGPRDRCCCSSWRSSPTSASAPTPSTSARCSAPSWRSTSGSASGRRSRRSSAPPRTARRRTRRWSALAGPRSKHNTYMSVPLVFMMIAQHATYRRQPDHAGARSC